MYYQLQPSLWRTCRALANHDRLRMLKLLDARGEMCVSQMADAIRRPSSYTSENLRMLNARGMLAVRRSGRFVYYSIGADPTIPWAADLLHAVISALKRGRKAPGRVFKSLTALTHMRRHMILYVLHQGAQTPVSLRRQTRISTPALQRHLRKLRSRNMVQRTDHHYQLSAPRDVLTATLLSLSSKRP